MDESKAAVAYTQRYTVNYHRRMVVALILQQCRVSKVSASAMNVLCSLLEHAMTHCLRTVALLDRERPAPIALTVDFLFQRLSQTFMPSTPTDFTLQQYIDYLISHNRVNPAENLATLFGQRLGNGSVHSIIPRANIEVIDS